MLKRQPLGQVVLECWEVDGIAILFVVLVPGLNRVPEEVGERAVGLGLISHFNDYNGIRQYYCSIIIIIIWERVEMWGFKSRVGVDVFWGWVL